MNEKQAKKRISELRGYYSHLGVYVAVNLFLITINLVTSPGTLWFFYPLMGWGIGLFAHTIHIFFTGSGWEQRKMQELTGYSDTKEELARLSERTENLITILASVDWSKIDPEMATTRDNLLAARRSIEALQSGEGGAKNADVKKEIEKLEEFVTSTRFEFYDKAAGSSR